jgi:protein-disulfide isomerase
MSNLMNNKLYFPILIILVLFTVACGQAAPEVEETPEATLGSVNVQEEVLDSGEEEDESDEPAAEIIPAAGGSASQGVYQDIAAGFTDEGFPYRGNLEAPLTLEEFSDYLCPFCGRHYNETLPTLIENYVAEGQVQYVFRDMPLVSLHPTAPVGHRAAICAGQQGADFYWMMHDELFRTQSQWSSVPDPATYVTALAEEAGVDMDAFGTCMASSEVEAQVNEGVAAGQALGFSGTPSFRFTVNDSGDSYTLIGAHPLITFNQWIEALLAGEEPPQEEQAEAETPELPFWASETGLAPDPERPGYTLAGDQYKGDPEAAVVVIEFSDFQCPACQGHSLEVQPVLDEAFVDTGQILWVHKHLPLQIHPQALAAAAAAECAADQGAFWEMHDLLFESSEQWGVEEPEAELLQLAGELDLDESVFAACLDSREPLERVITDIYHSLGAVNSTPSFIILSGGQGSILPGSRPAEQFVTMLQGVLDEAAGGE